MTRPHEPPANRKRMVCLLCGVDLSSANETQKDHLQIVHKRVLSHAANMRYYFRARFADE